LQQRSLDTLRTAEAMGKKAPKNLLLRAAGYSAQILLAKMWVTIATCSEP
jgi:hypothetical protein